MRPRGTALQASIRKLFGYTLLPPEHDRRPHHLGLPRWAHEGHGVPRPRFDIASAGSGFQQVLMLLAFLHTTTLALSCYSTSRTRTCTSSFRTPSITSYARWPP